jgi:hypothetical protein
MITVTAFVLAVSLWVIGWIWLMVIAFSTDHWGHGVGILLSCDVYAFVYGIMNWDLCRIPLMLHASGYLILLFISALGGG